MNDEKVKFLLNWNHFTDHLYSCMTKLMTDVSYSDIIIATSDKHMIYSHRFVLANSSKYFQRVLRHMKSQKEIQLVVALPEIKYEIFKILMNYMYKGETQVPHELLPSVIKAGQFLEINGLVNLNDSESSANSNLTKHVSNDFHPLCTAVISSNKDSGHGHEGKKPIVCPTGSDKSHSRENISNSTKPVIRGEKRTINQVKSEIPATESLPVGKGNIRANRSKLMRSSKVKEHKDFCRLPLKRKSTAKDCVKRKSSISDGSSPKKSQKNQRPESSETAFQVKNKPEKEENGDNYPPPPELNDSDPQNEEEKITIKEEPDDVEEVVYNELQCEFCHEVYINPSDWVKHMTEQHEDRGYQTYKDIDKNQRGSTVITCVVCSCVCFSAAEWANHLRMWHTDRELAVANMTEPKKNTNKVKKKSGT